MHNNCSAIHPPRPAARLVPPPDSLLLAALDYTAAGLLLFVTTPIILLAMLAVRLTSPGPVLYPQRRLGRYGRPFIAFKIRTMVHNAEALTGPRWSPPGDPRVIPIGRLLRRLHIDELPQLWNVLRGEMSLIGPRPERPEIAATLRKLIPGYDRRLCVKPGLTGFAQIHLPPDDSIASVARKLKYDLHGIRRRGFGFHLLVLGCTILKVLGLQRVYSRRG